MDDMDKMDDMDGVPWSGDQGVIWQATDAGLASGERATGGWGMDNMDKMDDMDRVPWSGDQTLTGSDQRLTGEPWSGDQGLLERRPTIDWCTSGLSLSIMSILSILSIKIGWSLCDHRANSAWSPASPRPVALAAK